MMLKLLAGVVRACHKMCLENTPLNEKATLEVIATKTHVSHIDEEITWWIPPNVRTRGSMLHIVLGRLVKSIVVELCPALIVWLSKMVPEYKLTSLRTSPRVLQQTTGNKRFDWFHHLRGTGRRRNNQLEQAKMVATPSLAVVKDSGKGKSFFSSITLKITWIAERAHHSKRANLWNENEN